MNINTFEHHLFGKIRKVELDNNVWLMGKDVCKVLEYEDTANILKRYVSNSDKIMQEVDTGYGIKPAVFINIQGVYDLCLRSTMPRAKEFQDWITHEVLMDIRNYGMYIADNPPVEEYDERGLPIVVEWTKPKMREMLNKYFVEIHDERRKNEELKKTLQKKEDTIYQMSKTNTYLKESIGTYKRLNGKFSSEYIDNIENQNIISADIPVCVAINNFFEASEFLGFGKRYDLFTTFLIESKLCYYLSKINLITPTRNMEHAGFFVKDGAINGIIYYTIPEKGLLRMKKYIIDNRVIEEMTYMFRH